MRFRRLIDILALLGLPTPPSYGSGAGQPRVLVFGKTKKAVHADILPIAGAALSDYLSRNGFRSEFTQNPSVFESKITRYNAIVFLDTSEKMLSPGQKSRIESYFRGKRPLLAIHSSIALGNDWPWFRELIGTAFESHPPIQPGVVSAKEESLRWTQSDEWYSYTDPLSSDSEVIASVEVQGMTLPVTWRRQIQDGARFWYTGMGHRQELFTDESPEFLAHILNGLRWAIACKES